MRTRRRRSRSCNHSDIAAIANQAQQILSLNHQYGESWLIAGEVADFANSGIDNVLCLQPFGCIANHVIAKGAEKKMRELYPQLNILFLDADAGNSEANFFNRLHFFVDHAKNAGRTGTYAPPTRSADDWPTESGVPLEIVSLAGLGDTPHNV